MWNQCGRSRSVSRFSTISSSTWSRRFLCTDVGKLPDAERLQARGRSPIFDQIVYTIVNKRPVDD